MNLTRLLLFVAFVPSGVADAEDTDFCSKAQSQLEMNQCAGQDYELADAELNRVYKKIKDLYQDDPVFLERLKQAQRAWIKLRDADFALKYPYADQPRYYGSLLPLCSADFKAEITWQRVAFLQQWLDGVEAGDACSGSIRIR